MHVDDVGTERDVHGDRHAQAMSGDEQAALRVRRFQFGEIRSNGLSESQSPRRCTADDLVEQTSCLFRHPEAARSKRFVDVF